MLDIYRGRSLPNLQSIGGKMGEEGGGGVGMGQGSQATAGGERMGREQGNSSGRQWE